MEEDKKQLEQIKKLENAIKKLPAGLRSAICWTLENFDVLEEMGKNSEMTLEEIQTAMETALTNGHYATLILLYITKTVKESIENEEF